MPAAQVVGELTFGDAEAVLTMRGAEIAKWEATFNV